MSETSAQFVPHHASPAMEALQARKPGGGSSALGTAPMSMPGHRTVTKPGIYESLELARSLT